MTLRMDLHDRDLRQRDLVPPDKIAAMQAMVIGVGAIGRQVAWQLAAMGVPHLILIDHDAVDVVNLAPQGYSPDDLGQLKVNAIADTCRQLNPDIAITTIPERFRRSMIGRQQKMANPVLSMAVFCCVDSISTRQLIWEAIKDQARFFVDARMSAEVIRVLASGEPSHDAFYRSTLFRPEQAFVGSCTAKSTIYTASIAAGLMVGQFTRWLRGLPVERDCLLNLLSMELAVT